MAKMPENDNLVMESIEDLFNQADSVSITKWNVTPHLEREQIKNMPIIGARPVSLEKIYACHRKHTGSSWAKTPPI